MFLSLDDRSTGLSTTKCHRSTSASYHLSRATKGPRAFCQDVINSETSTWNSSQFLKGTRPSGRQWRHRGLEICRTRLFQFKVGTRSRTHRYIHTYREGEKSEKWLNVRPSSKEAFFPALVLNADPRPDVFFADDITPALNCTPGDLPFHIPFQVSWLISHFYAAKEKGEKKKKRNLAEFIVSACRVAFVCTCACVEQIVRSYRNETIDGVDSLIMEFNISLPANATEAIRVGALGISLPANDNFAVSRTILFQLAMFYVFFFLLRQRLNRIDLFFLFCQEDFHVGERKRERIVF